MGEIKYINIHKAQRLIDNAFLDFFLFCEKIGYFNAQNGVLTRLMEQPLVLEIVLIISNQNFYCPAPEAPRGQPNSFNFYFTMR